MSFFDFMRRPPEPQAIAASREAQPVEVIDGSAIAPTAWDVGDPAFYEWLRAELTGTSVTVEQALRNPAVKRSVNLIAGTIGRLPLYAMRETAGGRREKATDHPLYRVLQFKPNSWQTPFQFKRQMQLWLLVHGKAYAVKIRGARGIIGLAPIHPNRVETKQRPDWTLIHRVTTLDGRQVEYTTDDILFLQDLSEDGVEGLSRVRQAADTIATGVALRRAAKRIFENGMMLGGNLQHPGKLSDEAFTRLKLSMEERHSGPENAGKWIITEEGMKAEPFKMTAVDSQITEMNSALIEDIGRVFDVPRPFLFLDDTSWGSGIEQLSIQFVQTGLAPWFTCWEDALRLSCIDEKDWGRVYADFDERELLRGTLKDQAEFYAKASGAGGHRPWMEANEIRDDFGLGFHEDGGGLRAPGEKQNVPSPAS